VALTWYVCHVKTGDRLDEFPLTRVGTIERTIGAATTTSAVLPVRDPRCPPNWDTLLDPATAMLVLDDDGVPLVGYVIDRPTAGTPEVGLSLRSLESIPESVNVRTHDFYEKTDTSPGDDEADAAAALLNDVVVPGWGFTLAVTKTGKTADHSYAYEEDRSVASALNDLMGAEGGPEWTIRLRWEDDTRSRLVKTIQIGPKIGAEMPGTVVENRHIESRTRTVSASGDDLAISVVATSDGSGPSRPMSDPFVDIDALDRGVPPWEARVHTTAVDDPAQLERIAEAGLRRRWAGITTFEMVLASSEKGCPRVGRDFDAGDTVYVESDPVGKHYDDKGRVRYDDPVSWYGMTRVIGWRATIVGSSFGTVTPVFWVDREVGVS
jgi:hypothetical protein